MYGRLKGPPVCRFLGYLRSCINHAGGCSVLLIYSGQSIRLLQSMKLPVEIHEMFMSNTWRRKLEDSFQLPPPSCDHHCSQRSMFSPLISTTRVSGLRAAPPSTIVLSRLRNSDMHSKGNHAFQKEDLHRRWTARPTSKVIMLKWFSLIFLPRSLKT